MVAAGCRSRRRCSGRASNDDNFEGLALGPTLANGDRSLLLVSDDGAGFDQSLYALRLVGVPEPGTALLATGGVAILAARRRSRTRSVRATPPA